ncbi:MAG: GntR family transcriptional repressor for pyruvate dehydrogenase complex [Flavobacterium sp.]|jgi:GntR family transcriptional repressor for pyruvate dehydrogenase complex
MTGKHNTISAELIEDILSGRYRECERLPSERDLVTRFAVNRGAVREAMKQLEQLRLITIGPGGARVNGLGEASLDVVGHLMARGELPDANLTDQILTVVNSMVSIAAEGTIANGSDEDIAELRSLVKPLTHSDIDEDSHQTARFKLMQAIMRISGNLVCQLISRTLLEQFGSSLNPIKKHSRSSLDIDAYTNYARKLDRALAERDTLALRATFEAFSKLNRATVMQAFSTAQSNVDSKQSKVIL